jgi:hypothetical protein
MSVAGVESRETRFDSIVTDEAPLRAERQTMLFFFGLVLPVIAMAPVLFLTAQQLWKQLPFRFFPLSIAAGVAYLAFTCEYRRASRFRSILSTMLLMCGMAIAVWGMYFLSPSRIHLALIVVVFGWALGACGGTAWTRVFAICLLFAVTFPLPLGLSTLISHSLQTAAAWMCSGFLEAISIPNVLEYGVLRVEDKQLLVHELCRDAGSCFALLAFAFAWLTYWRRTFLVALVVSLSVFFWSMLGDFVRLLLISIAVHAHWMDLTIGHSALILSCVVFVLNVACVIAFDFSMVALFAPIEVERVSSTALRLYLWCVKWPSSSPIPVTVGSSKTPNHLGLVAVFSLFCGAIGLASMWVLFIRPQPNNELFAMSRGQAEALVAEDVFPEQLGNLKRINYAFETRPEGSVLSQFSHAWQFDAGDTRVLASLDFPNPWVSPLNVYQFMGWKIEESRDIEMNTDVPWTIEATRMTNRFGVTANAWSALFNEWGEPLQDEDPLPRVTILSLLRGDRSSEIVPSTHFQFRLFFETGRELSQTQFEQYQALFVEMFDRIRQQILASKSISK